MDSVKQFFKLLRISHWSKAVFVLLGVIYSGSVAYFGKAIWAALAFCLVSSAVYIYNDLQDREQDRLHPKKRYRPLAAGEFNLRNALSLAIIFLVSGLFIAYCVSSLLGALLGLYLLINLGYNYALKNIPLLDVLCIASGFMLRVLAGTLGIGLPISWGLIFTATLISLFMALSKRRMEKQLHLTSSTREVLKSYSLPLLDGLMLLSATSSFLAYLTYIMYAHVESFYLILTIPFAAIGLWRFIKLLKNGGENKLLVDDPLILFLNDRLSCINFVCFALLTFIGLIK